MTQYIKPRLGCQIHPTAIVDPQTRIGRNVSIGPYAIVGANVVLGDDCIVGPHVCIDGWTVIGRGNHFFEGASIGYEPQDLSYRGEETYLYIGDHNIFRENVTVHRGTAGDSKETRIGNENIFKACSHVAHDCHIGNRTILDSGTALAGHVTLEDGVTIGSMSAIHQFCKIGTMASVGALTKIVKDIPPFILVEGNPAKVAGLNLSGFRKKGIAPEVSQEIVRAYQIFYHSNLRMEQALEIMEQKFHDSKEVAYLICFIRNARRGILR